MSISRLSAHRVLFWITVAIYINITDGYQCQLYHWVHPDFGSTGGTQYGPLDVGQWQISNWIQSAKLYSAGYDCHADFRASSCSGNIFRTLDTPPFGVSSDASIIINDREGAECVDISAVATPNPTATPSEATLIPTSATLIPTSATSAPSTSPTSSCLDYNNETSADGTNEITQFDDKHVINIANYFVNGTFLSEFNSSHAHEVIECVGSDCVIQCDDSASCLETHIEINVQNKTALLLC
eukprot:96232_1